MTFNIISCFQDCENCLPRCCLCTADCIECYHDCKNNKKEASNPVPEIDLSSLSDEELHAFRKDIREILAKIEFQLAIRRKIPSDPH